MTNLADSTPSPATHSGRSLYAALGGTFFLRVGGGVMGILTSLFLAAKNTELGGAASPYHISATLFGIIVASFFLTELVGSFVAGSLIDKNGPRRYMVLGPLFGAVAMVVTTLLHLRPDSTYFQFVIFLLMLFGARLLEGASAASANPASLVYIASYTSDNPKLRSRISSLFEVATLIGGVVGVVVGGRLWDRFGQTAFLMNTAFYLASVALFYSVRYFPVKHTEQAESHSIKAYGKLITGPRLRELVPAWIAVSAWLGILLNHSTFQLSSARPIGLSELGDHPIVSFPGQTLSHAFTGSGVGMAFGIYAVAFCIGILIWSVIIPRMRKSTAMLISGIGVIASSIVIGLINHTGPIDESSGLRLALIGVMVIAVIVESGFTPAALIYLSDLSELHPENRGMVMGLYSFLLGFGQLAGTIVAGPFADWQGVDGLLVIMGILGLFSILGVVFLRRDEQRVHEGLTPSIAQAAANP